MEIPAEYTTGKTTLDLAFHGADPTITQTFTAEAAPVFQVTSNPVFTPGEHLTVAGTGPKGQNVWATLADAGPNDHIAFHSDPHRTGEWTLEIPAEYTTGKTTLDLAFHGTDATITQTFTALASSDPALAVTSDKAYTMGEKVTVTGTADPGAKIDLRDAKGIFLRTLTADTTGHWTFTTGGAYTQDTITWKFASGGTTITETFTGKAATGPKLAVTSAKTYTKGEKVTVTGTAAPGAKIELQDAKGVFLRTLTADATGRWTFTTGGAYTQDTITWKFISGRTTITETFTGN